MNSSNSWVEKYRPKKFPEIVGQEIAIETIKNFLNISKKKAIILHGPPGTGKTTLATVIANETNSEIFELNASDLRNKNQLQEILKPAIEQQSLIKQNKIILIDEADGILGVDRGGVSEIITLMENSKYPIIITANDVWSSKLSPLRKKSELVQLKEINYNLIKGVLFEILKKENLFLDNEIITRIAINSRGDMRAAINDLQTTVQLNDPNQIFDERNKETDIFNALRLVFKNKTQNDILRIFDSVKMPIDEIMLWIEENIYQEYSGRELARAYDLLSKADVFKGRIYKQQYWRFLVYQNAFLSFGISSSKKQIKTGFTAYKKPTRVLQIWLNNQKTAKKKSIAQKYAQYVHIGTKRAMNEFPIIKQILKNAPTIQQELKLDNEEIAYLMR